MIVTGCNRWQEYYAPPRQAGPVPTPDTAGMLLAMNQPDLAGHIVKDVHERYDTPWRWTDREPTLNVLALVIDHVKLSADFTVWDVAFAQTGPLELDFTVNGNSLERVRYDTPGFKHFEKPVPPEWLSVAVESTLAVKIDKLYVAPQDGAKFGVIFSSIGLVP